jgi:hypothetical protein
MESKTNPEGQLPRQPQPKPPLLRERFILPALCGLSRLTAFGKPGSALCRYPSIHLRV